MTAAHTPSITAFALAAVLSLGLFSAVAGLSAPEHGGQMLVKATTTTTTTITTATPDSRG